MSRIVNNLRCICLFFAVSLPPAGYAQPGDATARWVDSLVTEFTGADGMVHTDSLFSAGRRVLNTDQTKAFAIARKLIDITEKQSDRQKLADSYRFLGALFADYRQEFDSARFFYRKAEGLYRSVNTLQGREGLGAVLHNYGTIAHYQGAYLEAMEHFTAALRIFDETGDTKIRPLTLNNLSVLYAFVKDHQKTEWYARRCVELSRNNKDLFVMANGLVTLGDALVSQEKYTEALSVIEEALKIGEENNYASIRRAAHLTLGNYYRARQEYTQAIAAFRKALELSELDQNEWDIARSQISLAEVLGLAGQPAEAHALADQGFAIAEKMEWTHLEERARVSRARAAALGSDFESAYVDLDMAYILRDTIYADDKQQQIAFLEAEYQTEQKELRIDMLERQRRLYTWLGIAGVLILLAALAFAVARYRLAASRRKLAEEEASRLLQEKQLVAAQAALDSETAERTRLAKDLHDGLGSMLSVVKLNMPQLKSGTVVGSIDVPRFQKALGMLDESIQELRRVAHHMMPESLMRYGLKSSLSDFCAAIPGVAFHYFGNESRLPEQLEILIYRCIHELVNNALKHASASQINVQLVQEVDRISFTVQDDGVGFDQHARPEGMGLRNVRQRVAAFQGELSIYSSDTGTEIHVELELKSGT